MTTAIDTDVPVAMASSEAVHDSWPSMVLDTASVPEPERLAYWTRAAALVLAPMTVTPRHEGPFTGRITAVRCGHLKVLTFEADPQRACRTPRLISRSARDSVVVGVQASGTTTLAQDGRTAVASPGDLFVFDADRPYQLEHAEPVRMHLFQLPRRVLPLPDADIRRIVATTIRADSGYAALVALFLRFLAASAADCPPRVGDRLAGQVADLLATLITAITEGREQAPGRAVVHRIRAYVDQHLSDQDLTPDSIAAAHHISARYLYRLFEAEGITIGRWIQRRRFEERRRELARRTGAALPIAVVAQRWGFVNAAHFSRAFQATYGMSPTTWRTIHSN